MRKQMVTDARAEELPEVDSVLVDSVLVDSVEAQRNGVGDLVGS
jgi:hypothetical protein